MDKGTGCALWSVAALALLGCNPTLPEGTGGTDVEPTAFGRGVVTINTDFQSTNVSLVGLEGRRLSQSFVSSTSLLSGDVEAPSMPSVGEDVVLLDRAYSIVTWVAVRSGEIRAQLHVDDDRAKNPWDYLPVAPNKAYVLRYDAAAGGGTNGDVMVVDPGAAKPGKSIDIAPALALPDGYSVHPARGVVVGDRAYVTTVIATPDYAYADSYVVVLDTTSDEVTGAYPLDGLHDCTGIALSPEQDELAIACSGDLIADAGSTQESSGVVVLARSDLAEKRRFESSALGVGVPGFSLAYVSRGSIMAILIGNVAEGIDDTVQSIDLESGDVREIHRAAPIEIGAVLCPARVDGKGDGPGSTAPPACFVTDSESGRLLRFPVENGVLGEPAAIVVDEVIGLPPRYLGQF
jgi:hypothetical protein